MKTYVVEYKKSAKKEILKLPKDTGVRIAKAVDRLSEDPRKGDVRPMVGSSSWRLRVGKYRVIYDIYDEKLVILIVRIRHRSNIYKNR